MNADPTDAELRQHHRVTRKIDIKCRWVGSTAPSKDVELRDFSEGGARLHSVFEVSQGAKLLLDFDVAELQFSQSLHAHVMWARLNQASNEWDWGVKFEDREKFSVEHVFQKLANLPEPTAEPEPKPTAADTSERRAAPRIQDYCPMRFTRSPAGWLSSWARTQTIDLSGSGVAFVSAVSFDIGAVVELEIQFPEASGHPRARGVIARCDTIDDGYRLGVQFIEMDQDSQRYLAGYLSKRLKELLEQA